MTVIFKPWETVMPATIDLTATPRDLSERLALANHLYREFHKRCFWHSPRELVITEELIPFVIKGLRTHGGHRGFKIAARLQATNDTPQP